MLGWGASCEVRSGQHRCKCRFAAEKLLPSKPRDLASRTNLQVGRILASERRRRDDFIFRSLSLECLGFLILDKPHSVRRDQGGS